MSGHSKWNNIKRKKEKTDGAKAKVFTKIGREISVAVRTGGPNPASNSKLADLIAKAKRMSVPNDNIVLATIFRAGLPFHSGFLKIFDHAGNGFVSAFREYTDDSHTNVGIHVEYLATPDIEGKTLILADPMLATGGSMEMGFKALTSKGMPKHVHVACVIAAPEGIEHIKRTFPENTTIWAAAIDPGLNEHKYIVPGFGDAGDLCYGTKL